MIINNYTIRHSWITTTLERPRHIIIIRNKDIKGYKKYQIESYTY
jgi:hypothetical protein